MMRLLQPRGNARTFRPTTSIGRCPPGTYPSGGHCLPVGIGGGGNANPCPPGLTWNGSRCAPFGLARISSPTGQAQTFVPTTKMANVYQGYEPMAMGADCARTAPSVDGTQMECIDSNGNVLSSTPIAGGGSSSSSSSSGSGIGGAIGGLLGNLLRGNQAPTYMPLPSSGPDMTTILLIGGIGIAAVYMLSKG